MESSENNQFPRQLREQEAAQVMNVSREKLRSDRSKGTGAPYRRYGRSIRYDEGELLSWMQQQSSAARSSR
ncbi:MAG: helix-turn-helix domain-containing protein [Spirochaetes bacterium]|nr:helix-turn-helix domain-containing protein [Spirochaetota bacterium]